MTTNKTPVGAYRGYGQPEVNFARERLMDRLARRVGMHPLELRRQDILRPDELPWINPSGARYDSGDSTQKVVAKQAGLVTEEFSAALERAVTEKAPGRPAAFPTQVTALRDAAPAPPATSTWRSSRRRAAVFGTSSRYC